MRNKIFIIIGLLGLAVSCIEEAEINSVTPTPGKEIKFSADLGTPQTRTLYGLEEGNAVKVKWVNGDVISVYGTGCAVEQADYAVSLTTTTSATPNTNDGQNYADELVKTGAAGVQWGNNATANFYAVYPAATGDITSDGTNVTVPMTIETRQYNSFVVNGNTIQGIPYNIDTKAYGMQNAIMYACTPNATPTDESGNPQKVNLRFNPFSTVLKFTIPSWNPTTDSGLNPSTDDKVVINKITLTAPENINIAGDFDIDLTPDTATAGSGTSSTITVLPSETLSWTYGKALEFCIFTIPLAGQELSADWKVNVEIVTSKGGETKGFSLKPTKTDNNAAALAAGQIHKINLNKGFNISATWDYNNATWLTTIPRNVYISDISLPGAWYATDSGYQDGTLGEQYAAGVRAFNIDARLTLNTDTSVGKANGKTSFIPNYLDVSYREYVDNVTHATDGTLVLACSGTEEGTLGEVSSIGYTVKEALIDLGELAASNKEEYVEAIITVAQKPFAENTGYEYIRGTVNPKMVLTAIANVLNDEEVKGYLYTDPITPDTTVDDVCGKVVVKVNVNTSDEKLRGYNITAPMLISEGSMASSSIGYISGDVVSGNFTSMNSPSMYWSNSYSATPMHYYYHQAQATTGTPTVANRKEAILDIVSQSYSIYSKNTHDAMFQLGIGGWTSDNDSGKTNLSSQLNPFVYGIINSMLTGNGYDAMGDGTAEVYTPAPVGAVLMNFATAGETNSTQALIDAIIELNGKYFLNRDTTQPAWPTDSATDSEDGEGGEV